jgi:guanosine-3',5'-bis(diphosphate) 3'-pyrophosphohydrolase
VPGIADKVCAIVVQVLIRTNPDCRRHYPITAPEDSGEALPEVAELLSESSDLSDDGMWKADSLRSVDDITAMVLDAALFAARCHAGQLRKDGRTPYINHPLEVAQILSREGGVGDPEMPAAALLHDTVEDTDTTPEDIERRFGPKVRMLVMELTDDKSLPRAERRSQAIQHSETLSARAKQIKTADLIANVRSLKTAPPVDWSENQVLEYVSWADAVQSVCADQNQALDKAYHKAANAIRDFRYYMADMTLSKDIDIQCRGLDEETARAVYATALVAAGPMEGGKSYRGMVDDHFEPRCVYNYHAPEVPCWFVILSEAYATPRVGGDSLIVAVARDSLEVMGVWGESGE